MIDIKTKKSFFGRLSEVRSVMAQHYSGKRAGAAFAFKDTCLKTAFPASIQNRHFQNDIIDDLWGILS